jgi:hypothetical protein
MNEDAFGETAESAKKPWAEQLKHAKILPAITIVTAKYVGGN